VEVGGDIAGILRQAMRAERSRYARHDRAELRQPAGERDLAGFAQAFELLPRFASSSSAASRSSALRTTDAMRACPYCT